MYDTAIRVALVKQRVRENTRWMQPRHDTAVGERERPCADDLRFLCSGGSDYRAVHSAHLVYGAMPYANGGLCRG